MATEIGKYKKHVIYYESGEFFAKKGKTKTSGYDTEKEVKNKLDRDLNRSKEKKEEAKRKKQIADANKNLLRAKYSVASKDFKAFIERTKELINEATLNFTTTKIFLLEMDPANVSIFHNEVACKGNYAGIKLTVSCNSLMDFVKNSCGTIKLSFRQAGKSMELIITTNRGIFFLPTLELAETGHKAPKLKFKTRVKLPANRFEQLINDAGLVASSVCFETANNDLKITAHNDDEEGKFEALLKNCATGKGKSKYSIEYLKRINLTGKLTLEFGTDFPLKVRDTKRNWFILAPRVE